MKTKKSKKPVTTLVPWFGTNRTLAENVGGALKGCSWVAVPFAGGMCELRHLTARTIYVSDLHGAVINLANVLKHPRHGVLLIRRLRRLPYHPEVLADAQDRCREHAEARNPDPIQWAEDYFVAAWMGRSGKAGTKGELSGGFSTRMTAKGGDHATRFRAGIEGLLDWRAIFPRCTFFVRNAFEVLPEVVDVEENGVYADSPFPGAGRSYLHNAGSGEKERNWHERLAGALGRFQRTRVVARFYDHPLVRELYPAPAWTWHELDGGRAATNEARPEVLLVRNGGPA